MWVWKSQFDNSKVKNYPIKKKLSTAYSPFRNIWLSMRLKMSRDANALPYSCQLNHSIEWQNMIQTILKTLIPCTHGNMSDVLLATSTLTFLVTENNLINSGVSPQFASFVRYLSHRVAVIEITKTDEANSLWEKHVNNYVLN